MDGEGLMTDPFPPGAAQYVPIRPVKIGLSGGSMKAVILIMAVAMLAIGPVRANEAGNKALVEALFAQAWNQGSFEIVDEKVAEDAMFHFRGVSRPMAPATTKRVISSWRTAFPDLEFTIETLLAEGDMVAARLRFSGTQHGKWKDIEPTGRRFTATAMMFFRFEEGMLVEIWEDYDEPGLREQLLIDDERGAHPVDND